MPVREEIQEVPEFRNAKMLNPGLCTPVDERQPGERRIEGGRWLWWGRPPRPPGRGRFAGRIAARLPSTREARAVALAAQARRCALFSPA